MSRLIVYIDGECPLCAESARRLQEYDIHRAVRFVDLHDPAWAERASERFTKADLFDLMCVEMPDGTWRSGYFAWGAVFEQLPAWRGVGLLMRFPLLYGIGPAIYRWLADHRIAVSRLLRLPDPCGPDGACRLIR